MKKFFLSKHFLILLGIFIVACLVRFVFLASIPLGFDRDEVANTYIGRFILQHGKDIYGNTWPLLYFNKFGDYPPVIPMYLSGLATYLFGFTALASRFPSAFFGALTILPVYFLFSFLHSKKVGLLGAAIISILTWHVVLSRSSAEGILGLFFCILGLAFLFAGIRKKSILLFALSFLSLFLTYFLYPSFRVLIPFILLPIPFIFPMQKTHRTTIIVFCIFFFIASFFIASTTWGKGRISQTSLLSNPTDAAVINNHLTELINNETTSPLITRMFDNKPIAYFQRFSLQYFDYLSPKFLFLQGGLPARYAIPDLGLVYLTLFIFSIIALLFPQEQEKKEPLFFMVYLLFLAPLPAFITVDDIPNIHRSIFLILPIIYLLSLSLVHVSKLFTQTKIPAIKIGIIVLACLFFLEIIFDTHQYFAHAGKINGVERNDGALQLAAYVSLHQYEYPQIIIPDLRWEPLYYLSLHHDVSPSYIGQLKLDFRISRIGNIHYIPENCLPVDQISDRYFPVKKSALIVYDGNCHIDPSFQVIGQIPRSDGTIAYRLLLQK